VLAWSSKQKTLASLAMRGRFGRRLEEGGSDCNVRHPVILILLISFFIYEIYFFLCILIFPFFFNFNSVEDFFGSSGQFGASSVPGLPLTLDGGLSGEVYAFAPLQFPRAPQLHQEYSD
jgi:hypothetical protein